MGNSTTKFGKHSTAKEVVDHYAQGKRDFLAGKVAVVTGGNSGIGLETCKALAYAGCRVIMGSRDVEKGRQAIAKEIAKRGQGGYAVSNPESLVAVHQLDLEDLKSVREFSEAVKREPRIDFLVFNAGIMAVNDLQHTPAGFEKQIGTNHFWHFYLFQLLRDKLLQQDFPCRVVSLSSNIHTLANLDVKDLHYRIQKYNPLFAYGMIVFIMTAILKLRLANSKLANMLFAKEVADQMAEKKICALSVHPGVIITNLQRYNSWMVNGFTGAVFTGIMVDKTIPEGAATTLYACLEPSLDSPALRGSYLVDCQVKKPSKDGQDVDKRLRRALWQVTERELAQALEKM